MLQCLNCNGQITQIQQNCQEKNGLSNILCQQCSNFKHLRNKNELLQKCFNLCGLVPCNPNSVNIPDILQFLLFIFSKYRELEYYINNKKNETKSSFLADEDTFNTNNTSRSQKSAKINTNSSNQKQQQIKSQNNNSNDEISFINNNSNDINKNQNQNIKIQNQKILQSPKRGQHIRKASLTIQNQNPFNQVDLQPLNIDTIAHKQKFSFDKSYNFHSHHLGNNENKKVVANPIDLKQQIQKQDIISKQGHQVSPRQFQTQIVQKQMEQQQQTYKKNIQIQIDENNNNNNINNNIISQQLNTKQKPTHKKSNSVNQYDKKKDQNSINLTTCNTITNRKKNSLEQVSSQFLNLEENLDDTEHQENSLPLIQTNKMVNQISKSCKNSQFNETIYRQFQGQKQFTPKDMRNIHDSKRKISTPKEQKNTIYTINNKEDNQSSINIDNDIQLQTNRQQQFLQNNSNQNNNSNSNFNSNYNYNTNKNNNNLILQTDQILLQENTCKHSGQQQSIGDKLSKYSQQNSSKASRKPSQILSGGSSCEISQSEENTDRGGNQKKKKLNCLIFDDENINAEGNQKTIIETNESEDFTQFNNTNKSKFLLNKPNKYNNMNNKNNFMKKSVQLNIPGVKQQRLIIKQLMFKEYGDNWSKQFHKGNQGKINEPKYIISAEWWRNWVNYVNFSGMTMNLTEESDNDNSNDPYKQMNQIIDADLRSNPGKIKNQFLLKQEQRLYKMQNTLKNIQLKPNLLEHYDFEALPKSIYSYFKLWYSIDFEIVRFLKQDICQSHSNELYLELYPETVLENQLPMNIKNRYKNKRYRNLSLQGKAQTNVTYQSNLNTSQNNTTTNKDINYSYQEGDATSNLNTSFVNQLPQKKVLKKTDTSDSQDCNIF